MIATLLGMARRTSQSTIAQVVLAATVAVLMGVAAHTPTALPIILILSILTILVAGRPEIFAYAAIILAFAVLPQSISYYVYVAGAQVYLYEPFLILSFLWALTMWRRIRMATLISLLGISVGALGSVWGLASGAEFGFVNQDVRPLLDLMLAIPVAAAVVVTKHVRAAWAVMTFVLWASAIVTLISSLTGFALSGREEAAALNVGAASSADATRFLTTAVDLATIVLCGTVVTALVYKRRGTWVIPAIPSFAIVFLAFSRNTLIAFAVALFVGCIWALIDRRMSAVFGRLVLVACVIAVAASLLGIVPGLIPRSGWLKAQLDAVGSRVFGGISASSLQSDPSAGYRTLEIQYLNPALAASPLVGHGFGYAYKPPLGFGINYFTVAGRYFAHQYYLWLAVKIGLLGSAVILGSWLSPVITAIRSRSAAGLGLVAGLVASLTVSVVAPMPNGEPGALVVGGVIGALTVSQCFTTQTVSEQPADDGEVSRYSSREVGT